MTIWKFRGLVHSLFWGLCGYWRYVHHNKSPRPWKPEPLTDHFRRVQALPCWRHNNSSSSTGKTSTYKYYTVHVGDQRPPEMMIYRARGHDQRLRPFVRLIFPFGIHTPVRRLFRHYLMGWSLSTESPDLFGMDSKILPIVPHMLAFLVSFALLPHIVCILSVSIWVCWIIHIITQHTSVHSVP
jgi:hypothetical protein